MDNTPHTHINWHGISYVTIITGAVLLAGLILFLTAGTTQWAEGRLYFALFGLGMIGINLILVWKQPALLNVRGQQQHGEKGWDRWWTRAYMLFTVVIIPAAAGLDRRYNLSLPLALPVIVVSAVLLVLSLLLILAAMLANPHFETNIRIQSDRNHQTVSSGPYRYVRHPGYLAAILLNLCTPFVVGRLWALLPCVILAAMFVVRTAYEDRLLRVELPGYIAYTQRTRSRLVPGLW